MMTMNDDAISMMMMMQRMRMMVIMMMMMMSGDPTDKHGSSIADPGSQEPDS